MFAPAIPEQLIAALDVGGLNAEQLYQAKQLFEKSQAYFAALNLNETETATGGRQFSRELRQAIYAGPHGEEQEKLWRIAAKELFNMEYGPKITSSEADFDWPKHKTEGEAVEGLLVVPKKDMRSHNYAIGWPVLGYHEAQFYRIDGTKGNSLPVRACRAATEKECMMWVKFAQKPSS